MSQVSSLVTSHLTPGAQFVTDSRVLKLWWCNWCWLAGVGCNVICPRPAHSLRTHSRCAAEAPLSAHCRVRSLSPLRASPTLSPSKWLSQSVSGLSEQCHRVRMWGTQSHWMQSWLGSHHQHAACSICCSKCTYNILDTKI